MECKSVRKWGFVVNVDGDGVEVGEVPRAREGVREAEGRRVSVYSSVLVDEEGEEEQGGWMYWEGVSEINGEREVMDWELTM